MLDSLLELKLYFLVLNVKTVGDSAVYSNLLRDTGQTALQRGARYSILNCDGQCLFMLALYKCALLGYLVLYQNLKR